jgi:hypothetical protein
MAGVQRGLAPGGLPSEVADAGGGPALGGQADGLGPAPDLEGDYGVGLQLPEPGVLLWGQVDAKGGRDVDGLMHRRLAPPHPLFSLSPYPNLSLLGPFGEPHLKAAFQGLGHLAEGAEGVAEVQRV